MKNCFWIFLMGAMPLWGQPLPVLLKNAEKEANEGHFAAAAAFWERAGRLKNADPELTYKAADAYDKVRWYLQAADCYRPALDNARFPMAGLRFARALKQQGRYAEARDAFQHFAQFYDGAYKAVMTGVVGNEIAGCELGLKMNEKADSSLVIKVLRDSLNTSENEFAPIPFSDNLLYYSLASSDRAMLMRSRRNGEVWGTPSFAGSLPASVSASFRSGCFSPDGSRFYYSSCKGGCPAESGGSARSSDCALYCLRRNENGWMEPERLRDYINWEGSTNLCPFVTQAAGMEYLVFASDRPGGMGGLDLYLCERPLEENELDFSFPQNLGSMINTGADEVSPFFDASNKILWFSTLGRASLGGMDIFKSENADGVWGAPQNLGIPFNSPADDYYFVLNKRGDRAFLVSNRSTEGKMQPSDDDLFEIQVPEGN